MASTPRKMSTSEPDLETENLSEFDDLAISEEVKIEDRCVLLNVIVGSRCKTFLSEPFSPGAQLPPLLLIFNQSHLYMLAMSFLILPLPPPHF